MNELFFDFIQYSIGSKDKLDRIPTITELNAIYEMAMKQSLLGILFAGLDRLQKSGDLKEKPEKFDILAMKWFGYSNINQQKNKVLNKRCGDLTRFFKEKGIRCCVLKGQGTALLYPDSSVRTCGDIDLWVESGRDETLKLIADSGYNTGDVDIKHTDVEFFDDAPVEVHFNPSYSYNFIYGRRLAKWMKEMSDEQFSNYDEGQGFAYPTIRFNLVYSLLHIYRHLFSEGIGLRQMLDYYYILIHSTDNERKEAYSTMCRFGMKRFAGAAMYVLYKVFGLSEQYYLCPADSESGEFVLNEIMIAGNFGHYDTRTKQIDKHNRITRGFVQFGRNFRFAKYYPQEVLWSPFWKLWHYCWRKSKGYI